jgi:TetR/AcrR family transcriptional repressor of nem operon
MVGPNKQFDQEETLSKALQVFWLQGYEATSMQDLVSSMGINRASMYQTYGNKHALFISSLDLYMENSLRDIKQMVELSDLPLDGLQRLFEYMVDSSLNGEKQGCFINNTAIEFGSHDPDIAQKIRNFWSKFEDIFSTQIKRAIENNELEQNTNAKQIASLLNINLQGLMVKSKTDTSKELLFNAIHTLFNLIRK